MSETLRRMTRSQTALARTITPEAQSSGGESVPRSMRSSKASARRGVKSKPPLKTEASSTYGSKGQKNVAHQLSAEGAMDRAVGVIATEVAGAIIVPADGSRRLTPVEEEEIGGGNGEGPAAEADGDHVSGKEKDDAMTKLTETKSFDREFGEESEASHHSEDHAPDNRVVVQPPTWKTRLFTSYPFFLTLLSFLVAVIAFILVAMWIGWRPLDGDLTRDEVKRTYVKENLTKMNRALEGHVRQVGARLQDNERVWGARIEGSERMIDDHQRTIAERIDSHERAIAERVEEHKLLMGERIDIHERIVGERVDTLDRQVDERVGELIQQHDQRINERLEKDHQALEKLKDDLVSLYAKLHEPLGDKINYFSRGLAAVSTRFSSPTLANPMTFKEKLASVRLELGQLPTWQTEKPVFEDPMSIFNPWETFGQKWCAPSKRGKLQAVIRLAYKMRPTELMIEHMAKSNMPDIEIGTAPKEVELWIQVLDPTVRQKIIDAITEYHPAIMTKAASQRGKTLDPRHALDKSWVPVGRWTYDIHARGNVQSKFIPLDLKAMGVKTQAVALRVNSNWGSVDSTCLYRVRLFGEYEEPPTEYTDLEEIDDEVPFRPWKRFRERKNKGWKLT